MGQFETKYNEIMNESTDDVEEIIQSIKRDDNPYFGYRHFHSSNMSDYTMMKGTIEDLTDVYDIDEQEAASIVQALTHDD